MTNARRHGQARKIRIKLSDNDRLLQLRIENDGAPLVEAAKPSEGHAGMGMRTMRYRTGLIGGEFRIEDGCEEMPGPRIIVDVPLF